MPGKQHKPPAKKASGGGSPEKGGEAEQGLAALILNGGNALIQELMGMLEGGASEQDEHNVFVRGTFSIDEDREYFSDEVKDSAGELFDADSNSEFDWYGGPNEHRARPMAARKLLQEQILPAFERDELVNIIAHSHGGNVLGELAAHLEEREGYLGAVDAGVKSGDSSSEAYSAAMEAIQAQRAARQAELTDLQARPVANTFMAAEFNGANATRDMVAQLEAELAELDRHQAALESGEGGEQIAQELALLQEGDIGDVVALNTPWLSEHDRMSDSEGFMEKADAVWNVTNNQDPVVRGAQALDDDVGRTLTGEGGHDKVEEVPWTLGAQEGPNPGTANANFLGVPTERGRAQHSLPTYDEAAFEQHVADPIRRRREE